jgi:hypothetical protein
VAAIPAPPPARSAAVADKVVGTKMVRMLDLHLATRTRQSPAVGRLQRETNASVVASMTIGSRTDTLSPRPRPMSCKLKKIMSLLC